MDSSTALTQYGLNPQWQAKFAESGLVTGQLGRVVRQDRGFVMVTTAGPDDSLVRLGKVGAVVVGDWVIIENETVVAVLERQSLLARQDPHKEAAQPIVANVELVLIVCGADRPLNSRRIERASTQAYEAKSSPVVVVTKADLFEDAASKIAQLQTDLPGMQIVSVSSKTGDSLDELRALMDERTSVMIGESGAGKSTLLNALLGHHVATTGEVRSGDNKGRHTTTHRELHLLPSGGALIDTPGVRALGLWADADSVNAAFADIAELAEHCRFTDCQHQSEPGCSVREGIASGQITAERAAAWQTLVREVAAADRRRSENERRRGKR